VRLNRYYSSSFFVDKIGATKVYVVSKKEAIFNGGRKWKSTMMDFVVNTMQSLERYHLRSNSDPGLPRIRRCLDGLGHNLRQIGR